MSENLPLPEDEQGFWDANSKTVVGMTALGLMSAAITYAIQRSRHKNESPLPQLDIPPESNENS